MERIQYIGSKNRLSKDLVPIIQSYITEETKGYLEPFVGGANIIDKIKCENKIGCDIHKELIELLKYSQSNDLPETITEEEYITVKNNKENYPDWYVALVGFCGSFGAKYFGGFARGNDKRDRQSEAIRNLKKQIPNLKDVRFKCCNFLDLPKDKIKGYVIYCDAPYRGTTKYKTEDFPYEEFYKWCKEMSIHNTVLISEYNMPNDFKCIWEKESKVNFDSNRNKSDKRIERVYKYSFENIKIDI